MTVPANLTHEALLLCVIYTGIPLLSGPCSIIGALAHPQGPQGHMPAADPSSAATSAGSACVRVSVAGHPGAQQDDAFNAYRQRQGGHPRPPMQPPMAMPLPHQPAHSSQSGSAHGSDFGSGDRASLSGSEIASPTKGMQVLLPYLPACLLAVTADAALTSSLQTAALQLGRQSALLSMLEGHLLC